MARQEKVMHKSIFDFADRTLILSGVVLLLKNFKKWSIVGRSKRLANFHIFKFSLELFLSNKYIMIKNLIITITFLDQMPSVRGANGSRDHARHS